MPGPRGVLDTNLIATGLVSTRGPGSALITAARIGRFELVVSGYLIDEVRDTLLEDFHRDPQEADELIALVQRISEHVEPADVRRLSRDPHDDPILALALESGAVFLATYDHDLMRVGSVGNCGVIHPSTALQLVSSGAAEALVEGIPGVSKEDRTGWRYEDFGLPLVAALQFLEWMHQLPANAGAGAELTTRDSWPNWVQAASDGTLTRWIEAGWGWSTKVRYPADGMAYVFCPASHPDQTEPVLIEGPTAMRLEVITLFDEDGQWKVHALGAMVPPADVGRIAYSW
jgi:putative PIN family toxin of toxin-antitoxin system